MAHVLQLMSSTDNAVTFTSSPMYLAEYVPEVSMSGGDVRERFTVGFAGSITTARANIQAVNRLFEQARNYTQNASGQRVFAEFDPGTSNVLYRSPVRDGVVRMTKDVLGNQWGAANFELEIEWTRAGYWEGPLTQIPLALSVSSSDGPTTDFLTVNNANDTIIASRYNQFYVASTDVIGDMPAPIYLEMVNGTTDASPTDEIYLFHNVYSGPNAFTYRINAYSTTTDTPTTNGDDTDCEGAEYVTMSWTAATETLLWNYRINPDDLDAAAGGRFAVIARWRGISHYTDMWLRLKLMTDLTYSGTRSLLWSGNLSLLSTTTDTREITWLDTFRLPPYLENLTSVGYIDLQLYGLRSTSDTHSLDLDSIYIMPISGESGWNRFLSVSRGVAANRTFVYDGIEGHTYYIDDNDGKVGAWVTYGGPILLVPNTNQKFYILSCDYLGEAKTTQEWDIKLYYRPRRNSL